MPKLDNYLPQYNAGIYITHNRFLIYFGEISYENTGITKGTYQINTEGEGYEVRLAYNLVKYSKLDLYPYIGLGEQEISWQVNPKNPATLSSALSNPVIASKNLCLKGEQIANAGLMINYNLLRFCKQCCTLAVGLDLQYQYGANGEWYLNDQLVNVSETSTSGFAAMFMLSVKTNLSNKKKGRIPYYYKPSVHLSLPP